MGSLPRATTVSVSPPFRVSPTGIRGVGEPRRQSRELPNDREPDTLRHHQVEVGALVVVRDREMGPVPPHLLVLDVRESDGCGARPVAALTNVRVVRPKA